GSHVHVPALLCVDALVLRSRRPCTDGGARSFLRAWRALRPKAASEFGRPNRWHDISGNESVGSTDSDEYHYDRPKTHLCPERAVPLVCLPHIGARRFMHLLEHSILQQAAGFSGTRRPWTRAMIT